MSKTKRTQPKARAPRLSQDAVDALSDMFHRQGPEQRAEVELIFAGAQVVAGAIHTLTGLGGMVVARMKAADIENFMDSTTGALPSVPELCRAALQYARACGWSPPKKQRAKRR